MYDIKKILVTTDFSETSRAAIEPARCLARSFGAKLALVYVEEDKLPPLVVEYMAVGIDEPGKHRPTLEVDELGGVASRPEDVLLRANREDLPALHGDGPGARGAVVHRQDEYVTFSSELDHRSCRLVCWSDVCALRARLSPFPPARSGPRRACAVPGPRAAYHRAHGIGSGGLDFERVRL